MAVYSVTACESCSKPLPAVRGARRKYCDHTCVSRAYRARLPAEEAERRLAAARERAAKRRRKYPDYDRDWHMRRYGLSAVEYDALVEAQGGVCAACGEPETSARRDGTPFRLAVDHDHATGRVRGLLCTRCNVAIGHGQDDPLRLEMAAAYLRRVR